MSDFWDESFALRETISSWWVFTVHNSLFCSVTDLFVVDSIAFCTVFVNSMDLKSSSMSVCVRAL